MQQASLCIVSGSDIYASCIKCYGWQLRMPMLDVVGTVNHSCAKAQILSLCTRAFFASEHSSRTAML